MADTKKKDNPTIKDQFDMLYALIMSDGMGNTMFSSNETYYLKEIQRCLTAKYGNQDYRVRFLAKCILTSETNEFDIEDKEWVRYILHAESEPSDSHQSLLEELKEKMSLCSEVKGENKNDSAM